MFAILNLSSYASSFGLGWTSSTTNLKKASPIPTDISGSCTVSFGTPSFTVNIPADSSLSQGTSTLFSYSYEIYVTTTSGTFMVKTGISTFTATVYPSQVNSFSSNLGITNVGSYTLDGQFISSDLKLYYDNDFAITDNSNFNGYIDGNRISGYNYGSSKLRNNYFGISSVNSSFVSVTPNSGSSSSSSFDGYTSFSPLHLGFDKTYNGVTYSAGSPTVFDVTNYSSSTPIFNNQSFYFEKPVNFDYRITYMYTSSSDNAFLSSSSYFRLLNGYVNERIDISEFTEIHYYLNGYYTYVYDYFGKGELSGYFNGLILNGSISNGATITGGKMAIYEYKMTLNDYMNKVNSQWDSISPGVSDLNQNTAQSVSDIGTAQTFETSAFDNFNTQFSSSGLDTFSLSFASTPLLWVSSIITTFYNNMPAMFQYLLMFVAFVGILCTVLNVFGRVAQRFGGGDSSRLNSKDVFSKIEKNGSI